MNTFPYRVSAVAPTTDYVAFCDALHTEILTSGHLVPLYLACVPSTWERAGIWIQIIKPVRLRKISYGWVGNGLHVSSALTANVQGSITRQGAEAGRKEIGGIRIPIGTDEDSIDLGMIQTGLLSAMGDLADLMASNISLAFSTATLVPQVGVPKGAAASIDCVHAIQQDTARVIRRRTVGRGI